MKMELNIGVIMKSAGSGVYYGLRGEYDEWTE